MPYIGRSSNFGVRTRFLYTATASQTTFSGTDTQNLTLSYSDSNFIDVHQNGVLLKVVDDYTATSGTSVVLATGATASDVIEITVYDVFSIANHIKKTGDAMAGALTNIDIDGTELVLDADGDTSITADTDDQIDFKTGGSDRVVIDSSGNVLVGRTSTISGGSNSASGAQIGSNGLIQSAVSGDTAIALQRLSDNGDLIQFRKDTTQVGSIGTGSSRICIGNGDTFLTIAEDLDALYPASSSQTTPRDNAVDLGTSGTRFNNLYLSGGVFVGGTGPGNKLEDYEEGTWTAQITDGSTDVDLTTSAVYTKIGNLVTVSFDKYNVNISSLSSTSDLSIKTLPFPSNATSHGNKIIHITGTSSGSNVPVLLYPVNTATGVALYKAVSSSQNMAALKPSDLASQVSVRLTFTYFTDS